PLGSARPGPPEAADRTFPRLTGGATERPRVARLELGRYRFGAPVGGSSMTKYVYDFAEGNKDQKDLLGGKGANLAEMTNLGLPVPPGFTITTEACRAYLTTGQAPAELADEIGEHLAGVERAMGKKLGDPADPLLVSVRAGANVSMPGTMEPVLNVGPNDARA